MRTVRALSVQLQFFAWAAVLVGCELNIRAGAESKKEGPTATLTSPNSGTLISASNASSFSFSGTCSESGATIQISINSGVIQENTTCSAGSWSRNIDLSPLPDGAINVSLTVVGSSQTASLGSVLSITKDVVAPALASASVTNSSPTNSTSYGLSYGAITGSYSHFCQLENNTSVAGCVWQSGTLPSSYTVNGTQGARTISTWLRDSAGNVSTRVDSNSVTYLAPISMTWSLVNGTNSINLTATPNHNLTVYYAVHNSNPGALTPAAIKALSGSCSGACVSAGSFAAVTTGSTQTISGLADKALYFVSAVPEDGVGLDTTTRTYSGVLPRRNSMQVYTSAINAAVIRYSVYVPTTYYNNPSSTFPVIMYVPGNGETFTDATNNESNFSIMSQTPITAMIAMGDNFNAIVVQPQCNRSLWTCDNIQSTNYLAEVIDQVNATYRTNPKRVSAYGMSFGGSGVLQLAYDYPAKVSAVVPVAGGLFFTGGRPATSGALCPRFATQLVALWAFNNLQDPWYSPGAVTGGGGTYPGTVVSTINANCTGQPDARFTQFNDNTTFPLQFLGHHISELILAGPYHDYGNCSGGFGFKYWNGSNCLLDSSPPTNRLARHPLVTSDLQTASTALTGSSATFTSIFDWMTHFSKP